MKKQILYVLAIALLCVIVAALAVADAQLIIEAFDEGGVAGGVLVSIVSYYVWSKAIQWARDPNKSNPISRLRSK